MQVLQQLKALQVNFTISRAILSDVVAFIRGDRVYTVYYTSKKLCQLRL